MFFARRRRKILQNTVLGGRGKRSGNENIVRNRQYGTLKPQNFRLRRLFCFLLEIHILKLQFEKFRLRRSFPLIPTEADQIRHEQFSLRRTSPLIEPPRWPSPWFLRPTDPVADLKQKGSVAKGEGWSEIAHSLAGASSVFTLFMIRISVWYWWYSRFPGLRITCHNDLVDYTTD